MKNKLTLTLLFVLAEASLFAQNIFHSREFWATKPSVEIVKQKMAEGHNILEMGPGGWDGPLLSMMADCDDETIRFIFDQPGIDVNVVTHHSNNYLMWTTQKGNVPVMKLLLEKKSKTDLINSHGQSLLMHAALSGKADPEIYELCLKNGGDIKNDKDEEGRNVMLTAIGGLKDVSFLNYFVSKGLTLKDTDKKGNGLFHYAVPGGNLKTLKELVAMGVSYAPNPAGENAFSFIGRGRGGRLNVEMLLYLKSLGLDPKVQSPNGQTLVHAVARMGADEPVLQFLTENGMNLSHADKEGNTPLMLAATNGTPTYVRFWLDKNNVNAVNKINKSALSNAVAMNSAEVVKLLIEKGAKTDLRDKDGNDLYFTLVSSYRKGRGSLQRAGDIMNLLASSGLTFPKTGKLLHTALEKDDKELLAKLIEWGEDINAKDKDGYTVLHYAGMKAKNLDLLTFLVEKGANPNVKTELDESVLDLIAENEVLGKQKVNLDFLKK
ncbi:ankyrin repeat domain-containing protein [Runella slithyformis]|nr:ankyrin repeat domain-containing protein [Runella slithyformis]